MNEFTCMSNKELLECFVIYKDFIKTNMLSKEPLRKILDIYCKKQTNTNTISIIYIDLVSEIANRWFEEHKQ
jgi:hypothetical protein